MPKGYEKQEEESPVPEQFQTKRKEEVITMRNARARVRDNSLIFSATLKSLN